MLATITVTSSSDNLFVDSLVTLREAIQAANTDASVDGSTAGSGADTIVFDGALSGQAITLGGTELAITEALTIDATSLAANVAIDAGVLSRIFNITATTGNFTLAGLALTGGRTTGDNINSVDTTFSGGAVRSLTTGSLTIDQSTVSNNNTTGNYARGGGIFSAGAVTLTSSTVSGNSTAGTDAEGGGIYSDGTVTLTSSTVSGNSTAGDFAEGGGIHSDVTVTLTNSTVSGNTTLGDESFGGGGGIYSYGNVTLTSSTVSGNSTTRGNGGGISTHSGSVTLTSSTVSGNNTTSGNGGGIRSYGAVTLTDSMVSDNSTTGGTNRGGGIDSSGDVTLTSSTVSGNYTTGNYSDGGGIFAFGAVTLTSSTVSGNSTAGTGADGGGIRSFGDVSLTSSTVSGNSTADSSGAGGGIYSGGDGDVSLTYSTVSGNSTAGDSSDGGGIFSRGDVTLTYSTVSGNSTAGSYSDGGGISALGVVTLASSTVTDNHANYSNATGGGIWNSDDSITIANSIVADNTAGGGSPDIDPGSGTFSVNYSLIGSGITPDAGTSGNNVVTNNPLIGPLTDNGGPTETHALLAGSLAIDAGNPAILWSNTEFDQRGGPFTRVDASGSTIDIGAYERQAVAASFFIVTTATDELDYSNGDVSLREAIHSANASSGADAITFDAAVFATPQTVTLSLGEIEITEALAIDATSLPQNVTIDANQLSRIFNITATTGNFTLAGLTLTGGGTFGDNVDSVDTTFSGGAVRSLTTGRLTLDQSTVSGSSTAGDFANGGGIFARGDVTLTDSTVSGNSTAGYSADGGGFYARLAVTLTNSTISENSTADTFASGGGIFSFGFFVNLTNSTVSGNSTAGDSADGGGIRSFGTVRPTNSTVSGNSTAGYASEGGGIFARTGVTLTSSTVSGNSTAGNFADGGGIRSDGPVTLDHSTVTDNHVSHANAVGGGIWDKNDPIVITNSIVAGNTAGGGMEDIDPGTGTFSVNYSLIGTSVAPDAGTSGNNAVTNNPMLEELTNNGGPTQTHELQPGSLALDTGDPGFATPDFDQRGAPFVRANGNIDMGAYERQTVAGLNLVVDTSVDENDGDYTAGDLSLREAVGLANGSLGFNTITFDAIAFATPQTIALSLGEIEIGEALAIDGPGQHFLTIDAQQQSRIFDFTDATGDFTLAGLTLTGGQTLASDESGGAIRSISSGDLTIDRSTIRDSSTAGFAAYGGGVYSQGAVTLTNSTVSGNSTADTFARGGGVYSQTAVTLTDSTVSGNSTAGLGADGGGISSLGNVTLTSSTVSGNFTTADSADGGGIFSLAGAAVMLISSTVSGNNTAGDSADGGGIYSKGAVTLTHSTISDNHANHANAFGGGVWNDNDSIALDHSIVAENTDGGGFNDIRPGTGTLSADYSLIGTGVTPSSGGNNVSSDFPNLGPLANNGGSTKTRAPLTGSPALDAGNPAIAFNPAESDQRGAPFVRVFDDPTAAGTGIDIGAYERQTVIGFSFLVDTAIDELDGDHSATDLSLREALAIANGSVGSHTITFDTTLTGSTLFLHLGELVVLDDVALTGLGADVLTLDAQGASRVLRVFDSATVDINNLTLTGGTDHRGGAIRNSDGGTVNINSSTISGSSATSGGGGVYNTGTLTVSDSTISGNSAAPSRGGGFFNSGTATVTNSTISGNSADYGGGIWNHSDGTVIVTSSTISDNSAIYYGGGLYDNGIANVTHSIVAGNSAASDADILAGSLDSDTFNLIGGSLMLGALLVNGGPTETHALLPGSPAIDAGDISASPGVGEVPLFDQRGNNYGRVQNGRIDIGAFEVRDTLSADFDSDGFITGFDFLLWQRNFGTIAPNAIKTDGDGDNDLDTDSSDLNIWETQFGQPAPAVAATFLSVVETSIEVVPNASFQDEVTAALTSTTEESVASRLPANFIVRLNKPGLEFRITVLRRVPLRARAFTEHIDEAFHGVWHSWPQQHRDLISNEIVRAKHGHSVKATRPEDEAFAVLADEVAFAGLRPSL